MPYDVDPLLPLAANLKKACEDIEMLRLGFGHTQMLLADAPVTLVPSECYDEETARRMFMLNFPSVTPMQEVVADAVAGGQQMVLFAADRPLLRWVSRQFPEIRVMHPFVPIVNWLLTSMRRRFVCHFHEKTMDVFFVDEGKLLFQNVFSVNSVSDAVYFVLGVWKSLSLSQETDVITLAGKWADSRSLRAELSNFIAHVEVLDPAAEFHATELARIKALPLDMQAMVTLM